MQNTTIDIIDDNQVSPCYLYRSATEMEPHLSVDGIHVLLPILGSLLDALMFENINDIPLAIHGDTQPSEHELSKYVFGHPGGYSNLDSSKSSIYTEGMDLSRRSWSVFCVTIFSKSKTKVLTLTIGREGFLDIDAIAHFKYKQRLIEPLTELGFIRPVVAEEPAVDGPTVEETTVEETTVEELATEEPVMETPTAEEPVTETPTAEEPLFPRKYELTEEELAAIPTEPVGQAVASMTFFDNLRAERVASTLINSGRRQHLVSGDNIAALYEDGEFTPPLTRLTLHQLMLNQVLPQQIANDGKKYLNAQGAVIINGRVMSYAMAICHLFLAYNKNETFHPAYISRASVSALVYLEKTKEPLKKTVKKDDFFRKLSEIPRDELAKVAQTGELTLIALAFILDLLGYPERVKALTSPITREEYAQLAKTFYARSKKGETE